MTLTSGLERVRAEKFGLVLDGTTARYFASREPCDLATAGAWPTGKHYGFAMRRNNSLLTDVNNVITRWGVGGAGFRGGGVITVGPRAGQARMGGAKGRARSWAGGSSGSWTKGEDGARQRWGQGGICGGGTGYSPAQGLDQGQDESRGEAANQGCVGIETCATSFGN